MKRTSHRASVSDRRSKCVNAEVVRAVNGAEMLTRHIRGLEHFRRFRVFPSRAFTHANAYRKQKRGNAPWLLLGCSSCHGLTSHSRPISEGGGGLCSLGHCFISAPHPSPRTHHHARTRHAAVWGSSDDPATSNFPACVRSALRAHRFISRDDAHPHALALHGRSSRSLRRLMSLRIASREGASPALQKLGPCMAIHRHQIGGVG